MGSSINISFLAELTEKVQRSEEQLRQITIAKERYQQVVEQRYRERLSTVEGIEEYLNG